MQSVTWEKLWPSLIHEASADNKNSEYEETVTYWNIFHHNLTAGREMSRVALGLHVNIQRSERDEHQEGDLVAPRSKQDHISVLKDGLGPSCGEQTSLNTKQTNKQTIQIDIILDWIQWQQLKSHFDRNLSIICRFAQQMHCFVEICLLPWKPESSGRKTFQKCFMLTPTSWRQPSILVLKTFHGWNNNDVKRDENIKCAIKGFTADSF